jgi:hypothetical protein
LGGETLRFTLVSGANTVGSAVEKVVMPKYAESGRCDRRGCNGWVVRGEKFCKMHKESKRSSVVDAIETEKLELKEKQGAATNAEVMVRQRKSSFSGYSRTRKAKSSFSKEAVLQRESFQSGVVNKYGELEKRSSGHIVRWQWQRRNFVVSSIGLASHAVALAHNISCFVSSS